MSAVPAGWPVPFALVRRADPTGVSDVGLVATGVVWPDGQATMRWDTGAPPAGFDHPVCQVATFASAEELLAVHGHNGATVLVPSYPLAAPPSPVRLFALALGAVWWWGCQWQADGPAVTWRTPAGTLRWVPHVTMWPGGARVAAGELVDLTLSPLELLWLPEQGPELLIRAAPAVPPPVYAGLPRRLATSHTGPP